jgi:hypothetical protein
MTLSTIAQQLKPTKIQISPSTKCLIICATHPNATIRFRTSDMILNIFTVMLCTSMLPMLAAKLVATSSLDGYQITMY